MKSLKDSCELKFRYADGGMDKAVSHRTRIHCLALFMYLPNISRGTTSTTAYSDPLCTLRLWLFKRIWISRSFLIYNGGGGAAAADSRHGEHGRLVTLGA